MNIQLLSDSFVRERLPKRPADAHKGLFGHLLAVCGCPEYRGAAALASLGALRCGAGLLTLACEENVIQSIASLVPEAIFLPLPATADDMPMTIDADIDTGIRFDSGTGARSSSGTGDHNNVRAERLRLLREALTPASAALIGCGRRADDVTFDELCLLAQSSVRTLIVDAGALGCAARRPTALKSASPALILTPHPGEMSRLTGRSTAEIVARPAEIALTYARETGAIIVLKGHRTVIASPDGRLFQNTTGNEGLSRGGSGDLLAGMIAGLAAQGISPLDAACCGVYLHGAAADGCAKRLSRRGMLPHDILTDLNELFRGYEV